MGLEAPVQRQVGEGKDRPFGEGTGRAQPSGHSVGRGVAGPPAGRWEKGALSKMPLKTMVTLMTRPVGFTGP